MTRNEAIKEITDMVRSGMFSNDCKEALRMAVKSLNDERPRRKVCKECVVREIYEGKYPQPTTPMKFIDKDGNVYKVPILNESLAEAQGMTYICPECGAKMEG